MANPNASIGVNLPWPSDLPSGLRSRCRLSSFVLFFSNWQLYVLLQYPHLFRIGSLQLRSLYFHFHCRYFFRIGIILLQWGFLTKRQLTWKSSPLLLVSYNSSDEYVVLSNMSLSPYSSSSGPVIVASPSVCHSANTLSVSAHPLQKKPHSSSLCFFCFPFLQICLMNWLSTTVLSIFLTCRKIKDRAPPPALFQYIFRFGCLTIFFVFLFNTVSVSYPFSCLFCFRDGVSETYYLA